MIFRDWQKSKAKYDANYPQQQVGIMNVPLWTIEQQEAYIKERIEIFKSAENYGCSADDRWKKGDKYAVMSKGRKTANKVCESKEEAEKWMSDNGKGDSIEYRPGENTRCESYCNVKDFCEQYKALTAKIKVA